MRTASVVIVVLLAVCCSTLLAVRAAEVAGDPTVVAGEVVVVLADGADESPVRRAIAEHGWALLREVSPGRVWVVRVPPSNEEAAATAMRGWPGVLAAAQEQKTPAPPPPPPASVRTVYALRNALAVANDYWYPLQWAHVLGGVPGAWERTMGSPSIAVGVVDSGFDVGHPDGPTYLRPGTDFVYGGVVSSDFVGHGTHVAGIIGAATNNSIGVAGIAPRTTVHVDRFVGTGPGGLVSDVVAAVYQQADAPDIRVINLSLGSPYQNSGLAAAVQRALSRGKIIVASAGNAGTSAPQYPAAYDGVLAVAAVGPSGYRAPYSSYGAAIRRGIAAPGGSAAGGKDDPTEDVVSTYPRALSNPLSSHYGYYAMAGTSMAAPFVSGVVALMLSANPSLDREQVVSILRRSARPVGSADYYGAGVVDAAAAVATAAAYIPPTPTPTPYPTPTPAPGTGEGVLFRDDFTTNRGWYLGHSPSSSSVSSLSGGGLNLRILAPNISWWLYAPYRPASQDVTTDVDVRVSKGTAGLVFGATAGNAYSAYVFDIHTPTGRAVLWRYTTAAGWARLAVTTSAPTMSGTNHLRVRRDGGQITAAVNGVDVLSATDFALAGTQVGVFVSDYEDETSAEATFDNFVVSGVAAPTPAPTDTPTLAPTATARPCAYPVPGQTACATPTPRARPRAASRILIPVAARDANQSCPPTGGAGCGALAAEGAPAAQESIAAGTRPDDAVLNRP